MGRTAPRLSALKPRIASAAANRLPHTWTADQRIRGRTLQRIRERHFEKHPLCVMCLCKTPPRTSAATVLDHRVPLHLGGADADHNRQGLCIECHDIKSAGEVKERMTGGA